MSLELAHIEDQIYTDLAILKSHGRDLLGELIDDTRSEVESRGKARRGGSVQHNRATKLSKKGYLVVKSVKGLLMSKSGNELIVDEIGRVFEKKITKGGCSEKV